MKFPAYIIDTFTKTPFTGNPTGVCYLPKEISAASMLSIAKELNFPVTAFVLKKEADADAYAIRYFTPLMEIPACGHATLAAVKVVQIQAATHINKFYTINQTVIETISKDELIMMSYPKYELSPYTPSQEIIDSLHIHTYKTAGYSAQLETLFIELESPALLRTLQPDYPKLLASSNIIKEVVITSVSDKEHYDYLLRSFCPWIGIDEDPVTGSVHSVLAGFWKERLNKNNLKAYQASARGGELLIQSFEDKVEIGGKTVIVLQGEINL